MNRNVKYIHNYKKGEKNIHLINLKKEKIDDVE